MCIIFCNSKESNQAWENMQLKYDNNKEMTSSLHVCNCIPIATKGPHIDTLHFEEKSLNSFYLIIILCQNP